MTASLHPATLWERIADAIPDATALVHGTVRRTWSELDDRSARLGGWFTAVGAGPGAKVGQLLHNTPEFLESYVAALKVRAVPFNINYRYTGTEVAYLIDNADTDVLLYDGRAAGIVADALERCERRPVLVHVGEGEPLRGAVPYEDAVAFGEPAPRIERSGDDVTMIYTGGTTGMPKGVIQKVGPFVEYVLASIPLLMGEGPAVGYDEAVALAVRLYEQGPRLISVPACPLMHNTGMAVGSLPPLDLGGAVVFLEEASFDPHHLWDVVEREGASALTIVGDPFAKPMLRALEERPGRDLSSLRVIASAGAMFSSEVKDGLLEHLQTTAIVDVIGASEGVMGMSIAAHGAPAATGRFTPLPGVMVLGEDGRPLEPGSGEAGLIALPGGGDGYYKDEAKSAATFKVIDGQRYTVPGDFATIEADGSLVLLGRGSACINTAGEKVYPEEVEEALKEHPSVEDALVFGVADERFGQRVAAVVSPAAGTDGGVDVDAVLAQARQKLAAYKVPRVVHVLDEVPRTDVGKPVYAEARRLFEEATGAPAGSS